MQSCRLVLALASLKAKSLASDLHIHNMTDEKSKQTCYFIPRVCEEELAQFWRKCASQALHILISGGNIFILISCTDTVTVLRPHLLYSNRINCWVTVAD